jgi:hypothetical protein
MKVFLSWSGTTSHQVALVFRDWLPSVIQALFPYVSSEDIDKGARWSTDIAKELEDSTFGILCVTKENLHAPWLNFEAGALSKTIDKAFVSPFLFDIKKSEVDGPILQFQSTIFQKEDVKKLLLTLNKACEKDALLPDRLEKAFAVWYPTLEAELNKILEGESKTHGASKKAAPSKPGADEILEQILDLSRNNQKLILNPEGNLGSSLNDVRKLMAEIQQRLDQQEKNPPRASRKLHPMFFEEMMHASQDIDRHFGLQIILSLLREDFPWLYEAGQDVASILKSRKSREEKHRSVKKFIRLLEFTFGHPMMREMFGLNREHRMFYRELPFVLHRFLEKEEESGADEEGNTE